MENLEKIKGVESFKISGDVDETVVIHGKAHAKRVEEMMQVMEVGKVREGSRDAHVDVGCNTPKSVSVRLSKRLQILEQEREELKALVASLSGQVKEMQELSKALSGMEALRKKVEDLADLI